MKTIAIVLFSTLQACSGGAPAAAPLQATAPSSDSPSENPAPVKAAVATNVARPAAVSAISVAKASKLTDDSCVDPDMTKIPAGIEFTLCDASTGVGTLVMPDLNGLVSNNIRSGITINGVVGSAAVSNVDLTNLTTNNVKAGVVIGGLTGTYTGPTPPDLTLLTPANLKSGVTINGVTGSYSGPSHDLSNLVAGNVKYGVTIDGVLGTWADNTNLVAGNVKSGVTINGVTGTLSTPSNCNANAQTGCVTTSTYKSADLSNLTAGVIKNGTTVAGVTGQYPSSTYTLPSSSGTDLDSATFNARIKSSASFQWFDSAGNRYTGTGDANIVAANIVNNVTIFGTTGTVTTSAPDAWDLRAGVTVGAVTGKLQADCQTSIDGNNGSHPANTYLCSTYATFTESSIDGNPALDCATNPATCMYRDHFSNLYWARNAGAKTFAAANSYCQALSYNGMSSGWRLPSYEEFTSAGWHDMYSYTNAAFKNGDTTYNSWTQSVAVSGASHYMVDIRTGYSGFDNNSNTHPTYCVHN